MRTAWADLLCDEDRDVAVLFVDLETQRHEPHDVDAKSQAPDDQFPVTETIQKCVRILQHLPQTAFTTFWPDEEVIQRFETGFSLKVEVVRSTSQHID